MAEVKDRGGKVQIVFLVDAFFKHSVEPQELVKIYRLRCRAISLCVLRLLLYFNSPLEQSFRTKPLTWGFKFFNSSMLNFEYKRRRFHDLDIHSFERFEKEMKEKLEYVLQLDETGSKDSKQSCTSSKALSCSLTEILHDFPWVVPDVSSPFKNGECDPTEIASCKPANFLFVVGDCPVDNDDLERFLGRREIRNMDGVMKEIFSPALHKEFRNTCNLSLFWIDTGLWCLAPDKMDSVVKDWSAYKLMLTTTKQLGGNLIPISSLTQDQGTTVFGESSPSMSKHWDLGTTAHNATHKNSKETGPNNRRLDTIFQFSFGGVVKAFLDGKNLIGLNVVRNRVAVSKANLLCGCLYYKGGKICHFLLSPMITNKSTMQPHSTSMCNDPMRHNIILSAEIENNSAFNSSNTCFHFMQISDATNIFLEPQFQSSNKVEFCLDGDEGLESEEKEYEQENVFCIKGVIPHCDISPSWLHQTKLYSCLGYGTCSDKDHTECKMNVSTCSSGLLQKLLMMISNKGLNMVVECRDPESNMPAIGVLQPVTSVCAFLSMVKREMLLMIEKLLLPQHSHGYSMVSHDVHYLGAIGASAVPVDLCHNAPLSSSALHKNLLEDRASQQSKLGKVEVSCAQDKDEFKDEKMASFKCDNNQREGTNRKQGNQLLLLLNKYYSGKQDTSGHGHSQETNMQGPQMMGWLCQDTCTSQRCETMPRDSVVEPEVLQSQPEAPGEPETNMNRSTLDVKQIDGMEIGVNTEDDFKAILEEGYQNCVNLAQSAAVFSNRTFEMIDHLKASGKLKDFEQIMSILKSSVLRDNKTLHETYETNGGTMDKDKIIQEYKVQILLRLELANKYEEVERERVADEITVMLRAISFQKDPIYLKSFLKNSIITRYSGNLAKLLCLVYDGLMQKPPKEILSPSHQVSSEEDTPLKCPKVPSVSSKSESVEETKSSRALVRRHSLMDVPTKRREIALPMKTKSTMNRDKEKRQTRSAVKKGFSEEVSAPRKPVTPAKKVRRNLFTRGGEDNDRRTSPRKQPKMNATKAERDKLTRRHTITSFSHLKKVVDTPVCKQVSRRMLHRQEWARRRSKTVTDVTIVGESPLKDQDEEVTRPFPRKSPRKQTATFYSSSTGSFRTLKNSRTARTSKASGKRDEDMCVSKENSESTTDKAAATKNKRLHRALSVIGNHPTHGMESKTRREFRQSPDVKESTKSTTEEIHNDESFTEVFIEIDAAKPSADQDKTAVVSSEPDASLDSPTENSYELSPIQSLPIFTRQIKSPPSIVESTPVVSFLPPSKSRRALVTSKSHLSTSPPILFQSSQMASKLSPSTFNAERIFDIAIPLTPVKSPVVKVVKSASKTADPSRKFGPCSSRKYCDTEKTQNVSEDVDECSRSFGNSRSCDSLSCRLQQFQCNNKVNCGKSDSESIVKVSSRLDRKRSLVRAFEPSTTGSKVSENTFTDNSARRAEMNDKNNEYWNTRDSEGQISDRGKLNRDSEEVSSSVQQQPEVFISPVATKRKRLTLRDRASESVSPLNQILKQRKNHRNTSGTSRQLSLKPKPALDGVKNESQGRSTKVKQASPCQDGDNQKVIHITNRWYRKGVAEQFEEEERFENQDFVQNKNLVNEPTDFLPSGPHNVKSPNRTSCPDFHSGTAPLGKVKFCPLQPHFTPMSLSAKSLKHLEESPVLIGMSPQSTDCFLTSSSSPSRKWSERRSPMDTSPKRLRHDPNI